ncbi:MAG: ABC transporter permease, partial [Clostridium sp.]
FLGIFFINIFQDSMSGQGLLILAILISGLSGMVFAAFHAYASINMKADQIISGTALNMFAPAFAIFVARMIQNVHQIPFNDTFHIDSIPVLSSIPIIGGMLFENVYITTYLGFAIFVLAAFLLYKTRFGLRLRSCGEHPQAADTVGINVFKIRYAGVLISGFLAGVGGLVFVVPTSTNFNASVAGYGFLALAVLIFGQWNPKRILLAALFFGIMKTFASTYSGIWFLSSLPISNEIYKMIPYIATLIVLTVSSKTSQVPKALGEPYDKGMR